ncbi:MAG: hypothetical protein ISS72_00985 [Candidatus Brocadiae bacterium]|nr:hypothetical protein [Candidatus Brocadiia bacterium]
MEVAGERAGVGPAWLRLLLTAYCFYVTFGGDYSIPLKGGYMVCDPGGGAMLTGGAYPARDIWPPEMRDQMPPRYTTKFLAVVARYGVTGDWVIGRSIQPDANFHFDVIAGSEWFILNMRQRVFETFAVKGAWQDALRERGIPATTALMHPEVPFFHDFMPCFGMFFGVPLAVLLWLPRSHSTAGEDPRPPRGDRRVNRRAMKWTLAALAGLVIVLAAIGPLLHWLPEALAPAAYAPLWLAGPLCWVLDGGFAVLGWMPLVQTAPLAISVAYVLAEGAVTRRTWKCLVGGALWVASSFFPILAIVTLCS